MSDTSGTPQPEVSGKEPDYSINRRIKELRHALKLSQAKFAPEIFISNGYLAKIELEHCPVNDRIITLIASKFGVNTSWLKTGEGPMFRRVSDGTDAEKLERMISAFNELYPNFKDYILRQMEELLSLQDAKN